MMEEGEPKTYHEEEEEVKDEVDPMIEENFQFENLTKELENEEKLNSIENQIAQKTENKSEIIPNHIKILFSLPAFSKMSCLLILNVHALIFYESKGSSLLLISFFTALARCMELIFKPILAHWSDNSKFQLGRRKPFMLFGCGFYALFLVLLFSPPVDLKSPIIVSIWFGSFYVLFWIADTVCNIPYQALGPELSPDTREREKLYMVFYFFQYIGVLFASVAPVIIQNFIMPSCDCKKCDEIPIPLEKKNCMTQCQSECGVNHNEVSLIYMTMFVGLFFVVTIVLLSHVIKERKKSFNKEDGHLVPTLFRLINNEPFMRLLVPWILDVTITQIFATMLPFYISFIINPQLYCIKNQIDLASQVCSSNNWMGITIFIFFIFVIAFMGLWHWAVQYIGKKKAWQAYSLISIVTYSIFLFCDEGMMVWMVVFSAINALPAGAGYLNDVFVSDSIDYDEFVTGKRNEGIFMVFTTFTPKIVGIVAQSIPLTVMSLIGFIPSKHGQNFDQPSSVKEFIRFYFIGIPVFIALISFIWKLKYPIDTEEKMIRLKNAIKLQNERAPQLIERIFAKTEDQKNSKIVADHFYNLEYLEFIKKKEYHTVKNKLVCIIFALIITLIFSIIVLILTFKFLEIKSLSMIPLVCLFIITISLMFLIISYMRLHIIQKVISGEYNIDEKYISLYMYQMKTYLKTHEITDWEEIGNLK